MPQLRGDDADQPHLDRRPVGRTGAQSPESPPPVMDRGRLEVSGLAQRLLAEQLADESRRTLRVKTIKGGQEHGLAPPGNAPRQPALGEQAQNVLVAQAAQLPARVQAGQERENLLVEERI